MKKFLTLLALLMVFVTSSFADTPDYLTFSIPIGNNVTTTISFKAVGDTWTSTPKLQYAPMGTSASSTLWKDYTFGTELKLTSNLKNPVGWSFRATDSNKTFSQGDGENYIQFTSDGNIWASGNIMSLLDKTCQQTSVPGAAFYSLFEGCSYLKSAPSLPATTLGEACYQSMFAGTGISKAPDLPATTLTSDCYGFMFKDCTSLTTAPSLPATTMELMCYRYMFCGCTSLAQAPELPATTLASSCYVNMFSGCTKLNNVTVGFTDWKTTQYATTDWLNGVSETGTFYCPEGLDISTRGTSTFPEGWNKANPLCFTAEEAGAKIGLFGPENQVSVQYSRDSFTWADYTINTNIPSYITLDNVGDKVYFRAKDKNTAFAEESDNGGVSVTRFDINSGKIAASGNIMSLLDKTCQQTSVPKLAFPYLFSQCTALTTAPELPATTLGEQCYESMFYGCTSLISPPSLPATTLAVYCYVSMFNGCTALTSAPDLPATTLAGGCYQGMFTNCTSLTTPPSLRAKKLVELCYYYMFSGCTNLNSVTVGFTDWNTEGESTTDWLNNVASTGTFNCPDGLDMSTRGTSTVPEDWNVSVIPDYLCFTAVNDGGLAIAFADAGTLTNVPSLQYSYDGVGWFDYTINGWGSPWVFTPKGASIYFKANGNNATFSEDETNYITVMASSDFELSGNIMSLLDETCQQTSVPDYAFYKLFGGTSSRVFLMSAPKLPATTLGKYCYCGMFSGCTNLNSVTVGFTDWNTDEESTTDWLSGVASTGTFTCPADLESKTGTSYIPEGWTISISGDKKVTANIINITRLIDALNKNKSYDSKYDYDGDGDLDLDDLDVMKCKSMGATYCPTVEIGGVKWATMNLGAESEYDYGNYYAWGKTIPGNDNNPFTWTGYCGSEYFTEWDPAPYDATTKVLKPEYDAAHVQWGGDWYMPTQTDFEVLIKACGYEGTDFSNITIKEASATAMPTEKGIYKYSGNMNALLFIDGNGNQLMLPAGGYMSSVATDPVSLNVLCNYWTSTCSSNTGEANVFIGDVTGDSKTYMGSTFRCQGYLIRPVKK